jgi:hypothetical protein
VRWAPAGAYRFRRRPKRRPDRFHTDFARIVRRDDDVGMAPERMPRRQWFGREHIERGAGKLAAFQRREQIGFDQMLGSDAGSPPISRCLVSRSWRGAEPQS